MLSMTIEDIKEKIIYCIYCSFPIKESMISRINGKTFHDDCIKVKDWAERRGERID